MKPTRKVLYWAELYPPTYVGGVEVTAPPFIQGLKAQGVDVCVVANHGDKITLPDQMNQEGVDVHRFHFHQALIDRDMPRIKSLSDRLANLLKSFSPDLIHFNTSQPSLFYHLQTHRRHPCKTLLSIRTAPSMAEEANSLLGRIANDADWITTVSHAMREDLLQTMPALGLEKKSSVIMNAIPAPTESTQPHHSGNQTLLGLGRLHKDKGFDIAIKAFAEIHREFPEARLCLAGTGPEESKLKTLAQGSPAANRIEFLGWVDPSKVHALISESAMVLMPSRWKEAFGQVALRASWMARPLVGCRVGGIPEIIVDGETGILVPPDDVSSLAQAIRSLLANPSLIQSMGEAGRRRAESFSFEKNVQAYLDLYNKLI